MSRALLRTLLASAAALLLCALCIALLQPGLSPGDGSGQWRDIPVDKMTAVVGQVQSRGDGALAFTGFQPAQTVYQAVATWRGAVDADRAALVAHELDSLYPGPALLLGWRRQDDPATIHSMPLVRTRPGPQVTHVGAHPEWHGRIVELGIQATALTADYPLVLSRLALGPGDRAGALAALRSQWFQFGGWNNKSINQLNLGRGALSPEPVPAAAAWAALSVLLLALWNRRVAGARRSTLLAVALVPWLALDVLWQKTLSEQLRQTRLVFDNKSFHEKHLADTDADVYRYINDLKDHILPPEPARILLLHDSNSHNRERLKAQYYLLPHNVYNFDTLPPRGRNASIDYVLMLGASRAPEVRWQGNRLVQGNRAVSLDLVDSKPAGHLFRVLPDGAGGGAR